MTFSSSLIMKCQRQPLSPVVATFWRLRSMASNDGLETWNSMEILHRQALYLYYFYKWRIKLFIKISFYCNYTIIQDYMIFNASEDAHKKTGLAIIFLSIPWLMFCFNVYYCYISRHYFINDLQNIYVCVWYLFYITEYIHKLSRLPKFVFALLAVEKTAVNYNVWDDQYIRIIQITTMPVHIMAPWSESVVF